MNNFNPTHIPSSGICVVCPFGCGIDRHSNSLGKCRSRTVIRVSVHLPHFGEEPFLSGSQGSGTVFFSGCNLACCFCQNYRISHYRKGRAVTPVGLAAIFRELQDRGCHNVNLVSPTHFAPMIAEALLESKKNGLVIPVVYNSNGYDSVDTLRRLEGLIDIYLPDMKYGDDGPARRYSGAVDYVRHNRAAVIEMHRQVGRLKTDAAGIAARGLAIRHLLLPGGLSGSGSVLDFLADNGMHRVPVSIMAQYNPVFRAREYPELNRRVTAEEYQTTVSYAERLGFSDILTQESEASDTYLPDFDADDPFAGAR